MTAAARRVLLDHLRRSGRIGAAASLLGSALMIKPPPHLTDGRISLLCAPPPGPSPA
ncbi:DegV family protein [Nonomuraea sp. MG754425]|uniref:DegV family protein n=1 Tax=Nonomuraea sp. MG754425 TaxID=2570319 RepID=UPI001F2AD281|nr:DegV family protein [Nonomuraea sp. MG754425]